MRKFSNNPTPEYLHLLVGSRLNDENVIKKAIRMWYILSRIEVDLGSESLTSNEWISSIYRVSIEIPRINNLFSTKVDGKEEPLPIRDSKYISSKKIPELLFPNSGTRMEEWNSWKIALSNYQQSFSKQNLKRQAVVSDDTKQNNFSLDELEPFYVTKRTITDTLKALLAKQMVELDYSSKYKYIELEEEKENIEDYQYSDATVEFDSYLELFSNPLENITRFYIYSDYKDLAIKQDIVDSIKDRLYAIWQKGKATPVELIYNSSRKGRYQIIVYPLAIYYHQRGFYLCAYDGLKDTREKSWHNYRIDRIESIEIIDWEDSRVSENIRNKCFTTKDEIMLEEIGGRIEAAYGFDFYQYSKTMVLRFSQDFHDRYIKNTWRHEKFKKVTLETAIRIISAEDNPNSTHLTSRIEQLSQDSFYTLPYRVNDNTVIMRLRAWGQNVEVLYPPKLRDRMRKDLEENWNSYSRD